MADDDNDPIRAMAFIYKRANGCYLVSYATLDGEDDTYDATTTLRNAKSWAEATNGGPLKWVKKDDGYWQGEGSVG